LQGRQAVGVDLPDSGLRAQAPAGGAGRQRAAGGGGRHRRKPDDWVICVGSSAAREAAGSKEYPSDLTIVGIIDDWDPDGPEARRRTGSMEINQVVGTLVCTQRVAGLDHCACAS
jgi:microcompartment protein CcmK/EutM